MKITKVDAIQIEDKPAEDYMEMGKLQLHMVLDLQRHME